jgi:hypothetical protein
MSVNLYNATTDTLKNVAGDIVNPKSVNNTIAPTEETTTASRAYNIGEQFFLNDVLYKATDNIAQGDTITVGTNCQAAEKLSEQIENINANLLKINVDITTYPTMAVTTLGNIRILTGFIKAGSLPVIHSDICPRAYVPFRAIGQSGQYYDCCLDPFGDFTISGSPSPDDMLSFTLAYA